MTSYLRPNDLDSVLQALNANHLTIIAGGTDFYPARVGKPLDEPIVDISGVHELRGISEHDRHYRIGAVTTWTDLIRTSLPAYFNGLKLAAREVGGMQVQNCGTLCGNICNASPAADAVPNLLALNAEVELSSVLRGVRSLPLADFITGNRQTQRRPEELVTALVIPKLSEQTQSTFLKLGARKYLVISIVMVALVVDIAVDGRINEIRIAVGACSAVAQRLTALEAQLKDQQLTHELAEMVEPEHFASLQPIDDMRASASYRLDAARILVQRALHELTRLQT